jgi:pyroglutamyl-peptidase
LVRKVLLTGFEPFGGAEVNPSWEAARSLDGTEIAGARVVAARLPVAWREALEAIAGHIDRERPDLVVSLGESGRAEICPERIGINVSDALSGDNAGVVLTDEPVAPGGPAAYFSRLPVKEMVAAIRAAGVPAKLSNSAGTYLCNHVMYGVLDHLTRKGSDIPAGFIHVPQLPEQVAQKGKEGPSMALETQVKGVGAALECCIRRLADQVGPPTPREPQKTALERTSG